MIIVGGSRRQLYDVFYPPNNESTTGVVLVFWALVSSFFGLAVFAYYMAPLDHPLLLVTTSRAVYVDEGFFSDAAQNIVKFGQFGLPYNFPHWFGSPLLTFLEAIAFSVFGPSIQVTTRVASLHDTYRLFFLYTLGNA